MSEISYFSSGDLLICFGRELALNITSGQKYYFFEDREIGMEPMKI